MTSGTLNLLNLQIAHHPVYDPGPCEDREEILHGKRCWTEDGTVINSSFLNGLHMDAAKEKMIQWLEKHSKGKGTVNYKLRDWLFSRQRYWGEPIPILHFADGTMRALELDELPLVAARARRLQTGRLRPKPPCQSPKLGRSHRSKNRQKSPPRNQHHAPMGRLLLVLSPLLRSEKQQEAWSREAEKYWMPVDLYVGGVEHAVLHLLYSRFWHKVLFDCGLVHTAEPFMTLRNQGLVTARSYKMTKGGYVSPEDVTEKNEKFYSKETGEELISQMEKMSKSKLNGVSPDEIIEEFGADALRLYEMFMGPFEREKFWSTDAVTGCRRFLNRFYDLVYSDKVTDELNLDALKLAHRLVDFVTKDIEALQFNTAIARMMEFLNSFTPLNGYPRSCLKMAVQMLYPFAPHIAEELWEELGEKQTITYASIPAVDPQYLVDDTAIYVVQINGKLRGRFELPKDKSEEELMVLVRQKPEMEKHLSGEIIKTIFVPNKLLNIVLR